MVPVVAGSIPVAHPTHAGQRPDRRPRNASEGPANQGTRTHLLPAFGDAELKDLTPLRIKTFVAQLSAKRKPATVRHVHALLSTILNDAVAEGLLLTNPCRFSRLPRAARYEAVYLSPAEVERLVEAIDPAYRDLVITAAGTGLRWGELAGLKRQRVDLLRRRLEVAETLIDVNGELSFGEPKTAGSRRYVSLPKPVIEALSRRLADSRSNSCSRREGVPRRVPRTRVTLRGTLRGTFAGVQTG